MSATCYYCGWWTDINGVCICGYSWKPTVRSDSCMAWKPQSEIVTNADRIRAMTDKELAEYLIVDVEAEAIRRAGRYLTANEVDRAIVDCLNWLRQEANEDGKT